jgi:starvation-inducible DNA-binding protein
MDKLSTQKSTGTSIDIDPKNRKKVADILNRLLGEASDLAMQAKHAHWNVAGQHFIAYHKLFDDLYERIGEHIDEIAERTAALGFHVKGRLQDAHASSRLKPFPVDVADDVGFVRALADAFGTFSNNVREAIDSTDELEDKVTSDMLTAIDGWLDKDLWFLEAHLRKPR